MSFKRCQNRIFPIIRSTFSAFVLLFLLTNESRLLVNCQSFGSDVRALETTIPQLLQQTGGDLTASETFNIPGLDAVRGFLVRNYQWLTPVAAAVPAKLATFMTLRALRQQAVEQEQQQQQQINGGDEGDCGGGGCCGGAADCDESKKNSMMVFVGDGNIQVKNHGDDDDEGSDNKYYTYQEIDEGKHWANFNKEKISLFERLLPLKSRKNEINIVHNSRPKRHKKSKSKSKSKSKNKKTVKTEDKYY